MLIVMCCYNEIVPVVKPVSLQGPARPTGRPAKAFQPPMSLVPAGLSISPLVQAGPASPILPGFPGLPASVGHDGFLAWWTQFQDFPPEVFEVLLSYSTSNPSAMGAREATGAAGIGLECWGETPPFSTFGVIIISPKMLGLKI